MTTLLLLVALTVTPPTVAPSRTDRLAAYIVNVYSGAESYARELAERILHEAEVQRLDPAILAAVCHNESWFQMSARGTSGEKGLWQILPDDDWQKIPRVDRMHWTRHIVLSTWRAATILAHHVHRAKQPSFAAYAHYNSGYAKPRRYYVHALMKRSAVIQRAMTW